MKRMIAMVLMGSLGVMFAPSARADVLHSDRAVVARIEHRDLRFGRERARVRFERVRWDHARGWRHGCRI